MPATNRTLASTPTVYFTAQNEDLFTDETNMYADLFESAAKYMREQIESGVVISISFDYAGFPDVLSLALTLDSPTFVGRDGSTLG